MARPKKNIEERKRIIIQVRATMAEKNTLKDFAQTAGMNITDFIKARTLGKPPKTKMATPDRQVLIQYLGELAKIGSNVNQIARAMNIQTKTFYTVRVKETVITETLGTLNVLSNHILNALKPTATDANKNENGDV